MCIDAMFFIIWCDVLVLDEECGKCVERSQHFCELGDVFRSLVLFLYFFFSLVNNFNHILV